MAGMAATWRQFWEGEHRIYVNDRHRAAHYRRLADDVLTILAERPAGRVLDYGCGDALEAKRVAGGCAGLLLFDAAAAVRERLRARFADADAIRVLDEGDLADLPQASVDTIVVCSVLQYLSREELAALLTRFHGWLAPGGLLVIADVIPPDAGMVADVASLLGSGLRHGFLLAALTGLAATFFSDYRRLRQSLGLTTYAEAEMIALFGRHGFSATRRPRNLGFNQARMTFLARPAR